MRYNLLPIPDDPGDEEVDDSELGDEWDIDGYEPEEEDGGGLDDDFEEDEDVFDWDDDDD